MDARLLNSQRVEVFETIRSREIDPLSFSWEESTWYKNQISVLRYPEDYFYFEFGYNPNLIDHKYGGKRAPGAQQREAKYGALNWKGVLLQVGNWIDVVKRELSTPDPWSALPGFTDVTQTLISPKVANTQFSVAETQQVAKGLNEIRKVLLDYAGTSKDRSVLIDSQIDSLIASSTQMGRKDWFNIAVGGLINLALMITLPPEVTRHVFDILKTSLNGIIHLLPSLSATGSQLLN